MTEDIQQPDHPLRRGNTRLRNIIDRILANQDELSKLIEEVREENKKALEDLQEGLAREAGRQPS